MLDLGRPALLRAALALPATAILLLTVATCSETSGPSLGPPAALQVVSGDLQSGPVGKELPDPLVARVVDSAGRPVKGQLVNFRVTVGDGAMFAGSSLSNDSGVVQDRWTLGPVAGDTQQVEARAVDATTGNPLVFGTFRAIGVADSARTMTKTAGDWQTGTAGSLLGDSLAVRLTDVLGNPVPGQTVTWTITRGGGSITPTSTTTSQGIAWAGWTLGLRVDSVQVATASGPGVSAAIFSAAVAVPSSATLSPEAGAGQTGSPNQALADSLVVQLRLADGRPVQGALVRWGAIRGGGNASPDSVMTEADGRARARWTLGPVGGTQESEAVVRVAGPQEIASVHFTATASSGYVVVDLGAGFAESEAFGINDSGVVVGQANGHAAIWRNGVGTLLDTTAYSTWAYDVNNLGDAVGRRYSYHMYAILFARNGTVSDLTTYNPTGVTDGEARAINDSVQVVGAFMKSDWTPFRWESGVLDTLPIWCSHTWANDVNNAGQIVGYGYACPSNEHAALWEGGQIRDLGTLSGGYSVAEGINSAGQVVGWSDYKAFLWKDGVMGALEVPLMNPKAYAINDSGQVVGAGSCGSLCPDSKAVGFLWEKGAAVLFDTSAASVWDINNRGDIVGARRAGSVPNVVLRATLWRRVTPAPAPRAAPPARPRRGKVQRPQ